MEAKAGDKYDFTQEMIAFTSEEQLNEFLVWLVTEGLGRTVYATIGCVEEAFGVEWTKEVKDTHEGKFNTVIVDPDRITVTDPEKQPFEYPCAILTYRLGEHKSVPEGVGMFIYKNTFATACYKASMR